MKFRSTLQFLIILLATMFQAYNSIGQGCVAIRNMTCSGGPSMLNGNATGILNKGEIQALVGYRYFKSFRHFRGKHEEPHRVEQGTEVINYFNSVDLGLSYSATSRLALAVVLPVTFNDRSSLYEHYGNSLEANPAQKRFHTKSSGIGDLRISANYWLLNPSNYSKGNLAIGLGLKVPTGDFKVQDDFHKLDSLGNDYTVRQMVDQSIQLGDGGWGVNLEMQGFHSIVSNLNVYFSGFYLSNPKETNGVLRRANADPKDSYNYFAAGDQFAARLGFNYNTTSSLAISLGGRIEGVPSEDLIGGSKAYRRPGYVISMEPGLTYAYKKAMFNLNVPFALFRNRVQSSQDKLRTEQTGTYTIGDAAFADYLINATLTYRFGGQEGMSH